MVALVGGAESFRLYKQFPHPKRGDSQLMCLQVGGGVLQACKQSA